MLPPTVGARRSFLVNRASYLALRLRELWRSCFFRDLRETLPSFLRLLYLSLLLCCRPARQYPSTKTSAKCQNVLSLSSRMLCCCIVAVGEVAGVAEAVDERIRLGSRVLDVLTPLSDCRHETVEKIMERRISGVSYMCWISTTRFCVVGFYVPD